jgi:hypothetical protein
LHDRNRGALLALARSGEWILLDSRRTTTVALVLGVAACQLLSSGCASDDPGITPPRDELYFPTGLALTHWVDPSTSLEQRDQPLLLVSNSNADLRYSGGTLTVLDLRLLPGDPALFGQSEQVQCAPDRFTPGRWECSEQQLILRDATIRVGAYPNEMQLPATVRDASTRRVFCPIRGDDEVVWADLVSLDDGGVDLRCDERVPSRGGCSELGTSGDCAQWDCDREHRIDRSAPRELELAAEPFGVAVNRLRPVYLQPDGSRRTCDDGLADPPPCDCPTSAECRFEEETDVACCLAQRDEEQVFVTHLDDGEVSLLRSDDNGVQLVDVRAGLFERGGQVIGGAFGVAVVRPGDASSPVYVSSRSDGDLAALVVQGASSDTPQLVRSRGRSLGAVRPAATETFDVRGLAVGSGGRRLYAVSRFPAALVAFDVLERDGVEQVEPAWVAEVCSEPSNVVLGPHDLDPEADFAYVVCFAEAAVFVVDTASGAVVGRIETGRGPNGIALDVGTLRGCERDAACGSTSGERCQAGRCVKRFARMFVANFLENTVGLIDLRPESPSYRTMVARMGRQSNLVEE